MPLSKNEIGILLSTAGYTAWVVADTFVKLAAERSPAFKFWRSIFW
jgi:hypothetical protein